VYDVVEIGFNYRLTDIQAALGASQLGRLDVFTQRRNELAYRYRELLADLPVVLPPAAPTGFRHSYHLFAIRVPQRSLVFRLLREAGIWVQVHYVPIHHHTISSDIDVPANGFPACDAVYDELISLPMYSDLTHADQDFVVDTLRRILAGLT
jgi:dTDP-4-amino-4,6-dideoxygalactose transaminase